MSAHNLSLRQALPAVFWVPGGNYSTLSDVNTLISNLGGNGGVAAFYDRRVNVTGNPNVTAWADCRTVGAGPTLVPGSAGSTSPTVSGAGSVITWATTSHPLWFSTFSTVTGVNAAGPCTIIGVLSDSGVALSSTLMSLDGPSPSCDLFNTAGGVYGVRFANSGVITSSGVASAATVRCVAVSVNGAGTGAFVQAYNQSQVATGAGVSTAGLTSFAIAAQTGTSSPSSAIVVSAAIVLNFLATTAQVQTIGAWAVTNHSAVAA